MPAAGGGGCGCGSCLHSMARERARADGGRGSGKRGKARAARRQFGPALALRARGSRAMHAEVRAKGRGSAGTPGEGGGPTPGKRSLTVTKHPAWARGEGVPGGVGLPGRSPAGAEGDRAPRGTRPPARPSAGSAQSDRVRGLSSPSPQHLGPRTRVASTGCSRFPKAGGARKDERPLLFHPPFPERAPWELPVAPTSRGREVCPSLFWRVMFLQV